MKKAALRCMSLCLGAGTLALALSLDAAESGAAGSAGTAAVTAPDPVRAQAREIFAHIVGIESSIGNGKVPLVAKYLADRFKAGGFADAEVVESGYCPGGGNGENLRPGDLPAAVQRYAVEPGERGEYGENAGEASSH